MKKLLKLSAFLLVGISSYGQSDSLFLATTFTGYMVRSDSSYSAIMVDSKTNVISIHGDTMACIKFMIDLLNQRDSIIEVKDKTINAAVNYTNHVSEYFKSEKTACGWNKYQLYLKKNGYTISTTKLKIPCD